MVRVAKALAVDSVPAALLRNVTGDPNPRLRLRSLAALATGHAGAPQTQPALRASLADVDPHVRLLAAQHLEAGPEVQATLEKLVEGVEVPGEVRASALERLAQRLPYASIAPVVRRAIQQGVEPLCRVAVEAAGRGKDETQRGPLTKIGTTAGGARCGKAVARALGG
jgi:HEAT repeat protein